MSNNSTEDVLKERFFLRLQSAPILICWSFDIFQQTFAIFKLNKLLFFLAAFVCLNWSSSSLSLSLRRVFACLSRITFPEHLKQSPAGHSLFFLNYFLVSEFDFWLHLQAKQLHYESSTLILCKELSGPIFHSLSVNLSGMRDTCPDLHFVQYIKA